MESLANVTEPFEGPQSGLLSDMPEEMQAPVLLAGNLPRKRKILVTSNCQTGGLALCLRALVPNSEVDLLHVWQITPDTIAETHAAIARADVWVTIMRDQALLDRAADKQVVRIPYLSFTAFHPDICYVRNEAGGYVRCVGETDYHSLLALWSYTSGLSVDQARAMFRKDVYREIGYFDGWDLAIEEQRTIFGDSELSFDEFIRPLMSRVPFMHTPNHPDGAAIAEVGKQIARTITGDASVMKAPVDYLVQDTLSHIATWPVYPEIAELFGLQGCYIWKLLHGKFFNTLDHFLTETYAFYDTQDLRGWHCSRLENPDLQNKLRALAGLS